MDKEEDKLTHLGLRGEPEFVARLDRVAETISQREGITASRSQVLRMLIDRGLEAFEKSAA
jgi:hypothetical protein